MVYFENAPFALDVDRLCKRLHIDGDLYSSVRARESLPKLIEIAKEHTKFRALWLVGNHEFEVGIPEIDSCETQIICLCHTTDTISNVISKLSKEGDILEAYLLNDLVNEVLFNVSNRMNENIFRQMKEKGQFLTKKYAPGEGGIPLELQKRFLDSIVQETQVGVSVNESCMLIPEKAMLYAFGADKKNSEISVQHDCGQCSNTECSFRIVDKGTKSFYIIGNPKEFPII